MAGLLKALDENAAYPLIRSLVRNYPSDVIKCDENGLTALHKAVSNKNLQIVNLLLAWGADPNCKDDLSYTPLHYSVREKSFEIAQTLLLENAWVDAKAASGKTSLHLIAMEVHENSKRIAELLIKYGANAQSIDNLGKTPVDYAVMNDNAAVLELFSTL